MKEALDIQVKGIVQGVGFRPFVYRLAKKYVIDGWVLNATDGVFIHAEGESNLLDEFVLELSDNPPAASRVQEISLREVPLEDYDSFEIRFSDAGAVEKTTLVSPDLATCDDCARELFNSEDRRYRYPFINCTNCGPRFTIIDSLPYDRKSTSMRDFPMCEQCEDEYGDPLDRRFHAQPDACFECGPHVSWREHEGETIEGPLGEVSWGTTRAQSDAIFARAIKLLLEGKILAVKGLGGFHLVCDAGNSQAVGLLRARKHREGKAFAVMAPSVACVRALCEVDEVEERVLSCAQRPIVLLRKLGNASFAPGLADALPELGVMLPYTPVQHLLLHDFAEAKGACGEVPLLVMTSGNLHDEPILTDDEEAYARLCGVADAFLGNNRAIRARYDDSVVRVVCAGNAGKAIQFIRRARGYAPLPVSLAVQQDASADGTSDFATHSESENAGHSAAVLAVGSEQKNTFTLMRDTEAFVSQHIGDMENAETFDAWLQAKNRYETLFESKPQLLACDLHPEYLASKWARQQSHSARLPLVEVQHHHAHVVSAMAEHHLAGPVCGVAFDGTGYGADGAIWGGEVLLSNLKTFERFANFAYVPMPGGAAAVRHPLRMAYGVLWAFDLLEHPGAAEALEALGAQAAVCDQMIEQGINTPMTSSVGRLFDAASALLGVCIEPTYEGEPAILLEAAMSEHRLNWGASLDSACESQTNVSRETFGEEAACAAGNDNCDPNASRNDNDNGNGASAAAAAAAERYAIAVVKNTATEKSTAQDTSVVLFDAAPAFLALLDDKVAGVPTSVIAHRFHDAFVQAIGMAAELVRTVYGIETVVLSGGVFMNRYLIEHALLTLEAAGFTVAVNRDLPPNDGCVSFGQAVVAWAKNKEDAAECSA